MNFALYTPHWLDHFLIAPFRWFSSPEWGMWGGCFFLALYCVIIGLYTGAILFLLHNRYHTSMQDTMTHYHNISVDALHAGNKEVYAAANKIAKENFGKSFFAQAALGMSSLWPVPFALSWLSLRFEGILLYPSFNGSYAFIFITTYIILRIVCAKQLVRIYPFSKVAKIKAETRKARGEMRKLF